MNVFEIASAQPHDETPPATEPDVSDWTTIMDLSETDNSVNSLSPAIGVPSEVPLVTNLDCSSCARHDDGWCWDGAKRTWLNIKHLELCPRTISAPEPQPRNYGCDSCNRHYHGWCKAVPGCPFYNIRFLRACPLIVSIPEAKRLALTYEEYQ